MYIALGALAAAFLALLMVPAVGARAERLARRRMEALLPRSLSELNAERDHLRAELALRERRLEQRVDAVLAERQGDRAELGRRAVLIDGLERTLAEREARIATLEADLEATRSSLSGTQADLLDTRGDLADTRETLAALRSAHADLSERHDAALQDIDAKRIAISDLETRLATQTTRADELERHLARIREALAEERALLADTRKALADEQARGQVLDRRFAEADARAERRSTEADAAQARLREIEAARDAESRRAAEAEAALEAAQADAARISARLEALAARDASREATHESALLALNERIEVLKADKSALEGALGAAREGRARIEREIADLRRRTTGARAASEPARRDGPRAVDTGKERGKEPGKEPIKGNDNGSARSARPVGRSAAQSRAPGVEAANGAEAKKESPADTAEPPAVLPRARDAEGEVARRR